MSLSPVLLLSLIWLVSAEENDDDSDNSIIASSTALSSSEPQSTGSFRDPDDNDYGDDSKSSGVSYVLGDPLYFTESSETNTLTSAPTPTNLPNQALVGSTLSSRSARRNHTRTLTGQTAYPLPYFSHGWNFPTPSDRHHRPTETSIPPSGPQQLNGLSILGIVLGSVAGLIILITILGCCTSWRRTPARDRIASLLNRFNLQREMQDREYNETGRTLLGNQYWVPPPPPYIPPPPVYVEGRHKTTSSEEVLPV